MLLTFKIKLWKSLVVILNPGVHYSTHQFFKICLWVAILAKLYCNIVCMHEYVTNPIIIYNHNAPIKNVKEEGLGI